MIGRRAEIMTTTTVVPIPVYSSAEAPLRNTVRLASLTAVRSRLPL